MDDIELLILLYVIRQEKSSRWAIREDNKANIPNRRLSRVGYSLFRITDKYMFGFGTFTTNCAGVSLKNGVIIIGSPVMILKQVQNDANC